MASLCPRALSLFLRPLPRHLGFPPTCYEILVALFFPFMFPFLRVLSSPHTHTPTRAPCVCAVPSPAPPISESSSKVAAARAAAITSRRTGPRSQLGSQVESEKRTAPSVGFGSAPRFDSRETQFISKGHSRAMLPRWTPGPGEYKLEGACGEQASSTKTSKASYSLSSDDRFGTSNREQKALGRIPGPGLYSYSHSVGTQVASTKASAGKAHFGTETRRAIHTIPKAGESMFYSRDTPGPGTYVVPGAVGKQQDGAKKTEQQLKFTKDERSMNTETIEMKNARETPGPGHYNSPYIMTGNRPPKFSFPKQHRIVRKEGDKSVGQVKEESKALLSATSSMATLELPPSLGTQTRSEKFTMPKYTVGKGDRFAKAYGVQVPGPGSYHV